MSNTPEMVTDPVCGMAVDPATVDPATAAATAEYEGRTYYFCSQTCVTTFKATPARYTTGATT